MRVVTSKLFFWTLLALPAVPMFWALATVTVGPEGEPVTEMLLHPSGETSARLMILAMALSPLRLIFPRSPRLRWITARRRYIGVAAFAYAVLHTLLYIVDMGSLNAMLGEFLVIGIWTGWAALFIFVPMALTSNDFSMRKLGPLWKRLQRLVYGAAVLVLVHWIYVHNNQSVALAHFLPLAALEAYRLWTIVRQRRMVT